LQSEQSTVKQIAPSRGTISFTRLACAKRGRRGGLLVGDLPSNGDWPGGGFSGAILRIAPAPGDFHDHQSQSEGALARFPLFRFPMFPDFPVAILAGGMATRLRPITERIPKLLVEVADEPFFSHQLRLLKQNGLTKIVLCVGHLGQMIVDRYG